MKCCLNCNYDTLSISKFCFKHMYWDDLDHICDIKNLSNNQEIINIAITTHIEKKLQIISNCKNTLTKVKYTKNLLKYISYKKGFLSKHDHFRLTVINKCNEILKTSTDENLNNLCNLIIKQNENKL